MKLKRLISAAAAAVLSISSMSAVSVFAEESSGDTISDGVLTYEYVDGGISVKSCEPTVTSVKINEIVNGYSVISIDKSAFKECTKLESVSIPKTVKTIGDYAFMSCTGLMKVEIDPEAEIESIPTGAFYNCQYLMDITLPESLTYIGYSAFDSCSSLTEIDIPDSVDSIDAFAFKDCYCLKSLELPDSLNALGSGVFMNCYSVEEITLDEKNEAYTVEDNILYTADKTTLYTAAAGGVSKNVVIPDTVASISEYAFSGCLNMETVTISKAVTVIPEGAFNYCSGLTDIVIPEGVTEIGNYAFSNCENLKTVSLASTLKKINPGAFWKDSSIESVTFPEGITEIGSGAFLDCSALENVSVPKSVEKIGEYALGFNSKSDGSGADKNGNFKMSVYSDSAAEKYAKSNGLEYDAIDFSLKKAAFIIICSGLVILAVVIAVVVMRKGKKAPIQEKESEKTEESIEFEDGYESILDEEAADNDTDKG